MPCAADAMETLDNGHFLDNQPDDAVDDEPLIDWAAWERDLALEEGEDAEEEEERRPGGGGEEGRVEENRFLKLDALSLHSRVARAAGELHWVMSNLSALETRLAHASRRLQAAERHSEHRAFAPSLQLRVDVTRKVHEKFAEFSRRKSADVRLMVEALAQTLLRPAAAAASPPTGTNPAQHVAPRSADAAGPSDGEDDRAEEDMDAE